MKCLRVCEKKMMKKLAPSVKEKKPINSTKTAKQTQNDSLCFFHPFVFVPNTHIKSLSTKVKANTMCHTHEQK